MELTVYLAGQIHDDWRERVRRLANERRLPLTFVGPQEDHDLSDNIGEKIKGTQPNNIFKDEAASEFNNLRTTILLQKADVVIALFGDKYRQWNTAMDASTALATGKPLILVRHPDLHHALKELAQKANAVVDNVEQALDALEYVLR